MSERLLQLVIASVILCFSLVLCVIATSTRKHSYLLYPRHRGYGRVLNHESRVTSALSCARSCSNTAQCTAANYDAASGNCSLLHVTDTQDNHVRAEDDQDGDGGGYMCTQCSNGLTAPVVFWPFIDSAVNVIDVSSVPVSLMSVAFAPAFPGSSFTVPSFAGNPDSWALINNTGELSVSSFTWMADIFPEALVAGALFQWASHDPFHAYGTAIFLKQDGTVYFKLNFPGDNPRMKGIISNSSVVQHEWNKVGVVYDSISGLVQMYVNGLVETFATGVAGSPLTQGNVAISTREHLHVTRPDSRSYHGKMACVKVWNTSRDLNDILPESLHCQYRK